MVGMPRTARTLGALTAGAALLAAVLWIAVRTLVGPGVPVGSAGVELGSPPEVTEVEADDAPRRPPTTSEPRERTVEEAPDLSADEGAQQREAGTGADADADAGSDLLVVSPPPVPLTTVARVVRVAPVPSVAPPTTVAPPPAPAPAVPPAPAPHDPVPAPESPVEGPSTSRALTIDDAGCAMPAQAGHGLGRAAAHADSSPPPGQHRRGCSVPEPAERPQPAATLPAPAAARAQHDPDGPGRGGGGPGGAGRGRGPNG